MRRSSKKMSRKELINIEEDNEDIFVYFMVVHKKSKDIKLYIKETEISKYITVLNKEFTKEAVDVNKEFFDISIYSFKILLSKLKAKIKSTVKIVIEENKNILTSKLNVLDMEKSNYFTFNLKFESNKVIYDKSLFSNYLSLTDSEAFCIYMNLLRNNVNQNSENENKDKIQDLIYYAFKALSEKKENYTYYFFATILIEISDLKYNCLELFRLYKKEKFDENYLFANAEGLEQVKAGIINILDKKVNKLLEYTIGEKDEIFLKNNIILFFTFFIYYYQSVYINQMIEIKEIKDILFDILIKNKLINLKLTKKSINDLIKLSQNYDNLVDLFNYNNSFSDLLEIINQNKKYIINSFFEINKRNKIIKLKDFVKPKKEDDLKKIYREIKKIILDEKKNNKFFVLFNDTMFIDYLEMNKGPEDFNNIILIYQIVKFIKENDNNSISNKFYERVLKILDERGFDLIKRKALKNNDILDYLENDKLILNSEEQFFKIIENLDINEINNDFIFKWKLFNLENMYKNKKALFYQKICESLKDIKNFWNLFILFQKGNNFEAICLIKMRNAFVSLFHTYNPETCPKTGDNAINLIYFCEIKYISTIKLIECIKKNDYLKREVFNGLIVKENVNYSEQLSNTLIEYCKQNLEKSNSSLLLFIIKNSLNLDNETIKFINENFSMTKDDFFNIVENNKLKIYKELIDHKFAGNTMLKYSGYFNINQIILDQIMNGKIEYYYINNFYSENLKAVLNKRLLLIAENNESIAEKCKSYIENHMNNIDKIINNNIIYQYLKIFFPKSKENIINKLEKMKKDILNNNLVYYTTFEEEYSEIRNKFEKEAKENLELIDNKLFLNYFNIFKKRNENEDENLSDLTKFINLFKTVIEENSIKSDKINYEELVKYMKILNKTQEEIICDINIMIFSFEFKSRIDIGSLSENLFLIGQKDNFIENVEVIINFIDTVKGEQTFLYFVLKDIYKNMIKSSDINIIKLARDILTRYKIYIKDNKFIEILIKLKNNKEESNFLFNKDNHSLFYLQKLKNINIEENNTFSGFEQVILFIGKFINERKWKDKDIIYELKNSINNNEELYHSFTNFFNKFQYFKDNFLLNNI